MTREELDNFVQVCIDSVAKAQKIKLSIAKIDPTTRAHDSILIYNINCVLESHPEVDNPVTLKININFLPHVNPDRLIDLGKSIIRVIHKQVVIIKKRWDRIDQI